MWHTCVHTQIPINTHAHVHFSKSHLKTFNQQRISSFLITKIIPNALSKFTAALYAELTSRCLPPGIWAAVGLAVGHGGAEHIHILGVTDACSAGLAPVCV